MCVCVRDVGGRAWQGWNAQQKMAENTKCASFVCKEQSFVQHKFGFPSICDLPPFLALRTVLPSLSRCSFPSLRRVSVPLLYPQLPPWPGPARCVCSAAQSVLTAQLYTCSSLSHRGMTLWASVLSPLVFIELGIFGWVNIPFTKPH